MKIAITMTRKVRRKLRWIARQAQEADEADRAQELLIRRMMRMMDRGVRPVPTYRRKGRTPNGANYCPSRITAGSDPATRRTGRAHAKALHDTHGPCRRPWDGRGAVMRNRIAREADAIHPINPKTY